MKSAALAAGAATLLGFACLGAAAAKADVVYDYTGYDFTSAASPYTTSDFISGNFHLSSALADNLPYTAITPTAYSFSDGVQTLNNTNATFNVYFDVSTDSVGDITEWFIQIATGPYDTIRTVYLNPSNCSANCQSDVAAKLLSNSPFLMA